MKRVEQLVVTTKMMTIAGFVDATAVLGIHDSDEKGKARLAEEREKRSNERKKKTEWDGRSQLYGRNAIGGT